MNTILNFFKNFLVLEDLPPKLAEKSKRDPIKSNEIINKIPEGATIISRPDHCVSRKQVSDHALKVLYRLRKEGFDAYLVGGCVRDLLLGREPKDFDVVTNAEPDEIADIFSNCRLIGKRFRLAHVFYGREFVEVATFRKAISDDKKEVPRLTKEGRILHDNIYGSIEEDVWRRDFTINALYYNITDFSIVDFVGGMADHQAGLIRLIGDSNERFREDPVRMLRAIRFAVKLAFKLHHDCEQAIPLNAHLLASIPAARLHDEVTKLFLSGYGVQTFEMLRQYGLFGVLFPAVEKSLSHEASHFPKMMVINALKNSDLRIVEGKPVTSYFLFAVLLWEPMQLRAKEKITKGTLESTAYYEAASEVLTQQIRRVSLPRHLALEIREVWNLQPKFDVRAGMKPHRLMSHPRFRAAYDFLLLRAQTGSASLEVAEWWTAYQVANEADQRKMTQPKQQPKSDKPKKKRIYRKKKVPAPSSSEF